MTLLGPQQPEAEGGLLELEFYSGSRKELEKAEMEPPEGWGTRREPASVTDTNLR